MADVMRTLFDGSFVSFDYTNHRGETKKREVRFRGLDFGSNEWYPERQWFLRGLDIKREVIRSFALSKIDFNTIAMR